MIGFAHRGARSQARENTLEAFTLALRLGATGLESDAWLSADGVAVLDHDGVVRSRWRRRAIATIEHVALPGYMPSLDDLYATCGHDFELSLDIKDDAAMAAVLGSARKVRAARRLWACHHSLLTLATWRGWASDIRLVYSSSTSRFPEGVASAAAQARASGVNALNLRLREWTDQAVAAVHEQGLLAFGWGAHSDEALARAVALGLDGVYSDDVERMMRALAGSA